MKWRAVYGVPGDPKRRHEMIVEASNIEKAKAIANLKFHFMFVSWDRKAKRLSLERVNANAR